jgi:GTP cyclohydrolase I
MMNQSKIEDGVRLILKGLGCDMKDRNFAATPERVAKVYKELFTVEETEFATFEENYNDFILVRNHVVWSMCPHHLLPVRMEVSVAYIPNGEVLGLSKLIRVINEANTGPIMQESFTRTIVDKLQLLAVGAKGSACIVTGVHDCMRIRGVRSPADVVTYNLTGEFLHSQPLQDRFFELCRGR